MAQAVKNGGPYTKDEQEKRRNEVSRLYFEYGYSARKISEAMKINRNTINSDIKYLFSQIKEEVKQDSEDHIVNQIGRMEAQRSRIIETITSGNLADSARYEKLLLEIDSKINNLYLRINAEAPEEEQLEINEEQIRDFVLYLIVKYAEKIGFEKEVITSEIINIFHCTKSEADEMFSQLEELVFYIRSGRILVVME